MAAAVAARTRQPRIGTAVLIAPLHDPVHVAEEAAVVDLISAGRLDLGLGAGYRQAEFDLFAADYADRYRTTDNVARRLRELWADGSLTPAPAQDRIPIWMGYNGPQGARRAGRLGEGLLSVEPALLAPYLEGLDEGGHPASTARMSGVLNVYATDDPDGDWPVVARHHAYQWDSYRRHAVAGTPLPQPRPVDPEKSRARGLAQGMGNLLYGTPEQTAARIAAHVAGLPVATVFFWVALGGMPEEMAAAHLRTIATRLGPLLSA
jgi:alkanesulfonate monooxygenase SsuD/methylene tetrahydromethanopterin reductase-like flavin-dependent oxidoreductase (luciferase family)